MTEEEVCKRVGISKSKLDYLFSSGKLSMRSIVSPRVFVVADIKLIREALFNLSNSQVSKSKLVFKEN